MQISRWDPLKDHLGVMRGFADLVDGTAPAGAELILAGPNVNAVADDPEGVAVFNEILTAWRQLSHADRRRIQLVNLPMADAEENAAIVNALQRHAAVIVQKSLHEGFGLTVTEAMWKGRPIVASATGGIQDQITDGVHGLLIEDPHDLQSLQRSGPTTAGGPALRRATRSQCARACSPGVSGYCATCSSTSTCWPGSSSGPDTAWWSRVGQSG